jgi:hypothetical protein
MRLAVTPEDQRRWMDAWRLAAVALEEVKREELQAMTEEEACAASDMLLSMGPFPESGRARSETSGLVEQQRIFMRARR